MLNDTLGMAHYVLSRVVMAYMHCPLSTVLSSTKSNMHAKGTKAQKSKGPQTISWTFTPLLPKYNFWPACDYDTATASEAGHQECVRPKKCFLVSFGTRLSLVTGVTPQAQSRVLSG